MVLRNIIRKISGIAMFLAIAFCFSCEKSFPGLILCRDCLDTEPESVSLDIKIGADNYYRAADIEVYEGYLEDSVLYKTSSTSGNTRITVIINKMYTLVAKYYFPDKDYYVVNSVTPRARYDDVQCEKACYYVVDKSVDLRLKHIR